MPELPEVETVRRGLAPVLEGHRISRVILRREGLRFPFPDGFGQSLSGKQVESVGRRAKFLLITMEDGVVLIAHLGMSGSFRIFHHPPPEEEKHDHVIFETEAGTTIRYNDPRRFGFMILTTQDELLDHQMLTKLGPEPINPGLAAPELTQRLSMRKGPIKTALLDQSVIAGLGNIYVCEALFRAGISPKRKALTLRGKRSERLAPIIQQVLFEAIEAGGSSLRDHQQTSGELGYFQHQFSVYGREGEACLTCGPDFLVQRINQSGRSTFYCPHCQR